MTETEWFAAKDLLEMVFCISEHASYRKLKLITSALHQRVAPGFPALWFPEQPEPTWFRAPGKPQVYCPGGRTLLNMIFGTWNEIVGAEDRLEKVFLPLARCILGNPFRPLTPDSRCVTPTVLALAEAAYELAPPGAELDAGRLAVLADALEEAGGPAELLEYLRGPGPHACGCWAVDAVLGLG